MPANQQKRTVTKTVNADQYMPVYDQKGYETMISIANFISSLAPVIDSGFLPIIGGTMTGPIVFNDTDGAFMYNLDDDEIRIRLTFDTILIQAGLAGDTAMTLTKSKKSIESIGEAFSFQSWDQSTYLIIDNAIKQLDFVCDNSYFKISPNESYLGIDLAYFSVSPTETEMTDGVSRIYMDTAGAVNLETNGNAALTINGTSNISRITGDSTTFTMSTKFSSTGMQIYNNNSAALAGGLIAGDWYHTHSGELRIVV